MLIASWPGMEITLENEAFRFTRLTNFWSGATAVQHASPWVELNSLDECRMLLYHTLAKFLDEPFVCLCTGRLLMSRMSLPVVCAWWANGYGTVRTTRAVTWGRLPYYYGSSTAASTMNSTDL